MTHRDATPWPSREDSKCAKAPGPLAWRREPHMFAMRPSSKPSLPPHDAAQLLLPAQSENEKLPQPGVRCGIERDISREVRSMENDGCKERVCATSMSRRTSRRTRPTGPRRSMLERHGIRAMRSASTSASEPRSHSVGPRLSAGSPDPYCAEPRP
jgi:hypothetical protein